MSNGAPRISLVTPNRNGGEFIEQTLGSVLGQGYPNLEYVVVDGASTDDSLNIIHRYRRDLSQVISEPDHGHTEALNKGFALTSGEVMGWINSDDMLLPGCLAAVGEIFREYPEVDWVTGRATAMTERGDVDTVRDARPWSWVRFLGGDYRHVQQESTFWRRKLWNQAGGYLSNDHTLASDFELWTRFFLWAPLYSVDALLGSFRVRHGQQSRIAADRYDAECRAALRSLWEAVPVAALAEFTDVLATHDSVQPSSDFPAVSQALAGADAPVIVTDDRSKSFSMEGTAPQAPRLRESPTAVQGEFDPATPRRVVWNAAPDFSEATFVGLEVAFPVLPTSSGSPVMWVRAGPVALQYFGGGQVAVQIKLATRTIAQDIAMDGEELRIKVATGETSFLIIGNGEVVPRERYPGEDLDLYTRVVTVDTRETEVDGFATPAIRTASRSGGDEVQVHELQPPRARASSPSKAPNHLPGTRPNQNGSADGIRALAGRHKGERCFVMGNGPSLNKMDLGRLAGESIFACNAAFLLFDRIHWRPEYYTCVDVRVLRDRANDIVEMLQEEPNVTSFFPRQIALHDGSGQVFDTHSIIPPGNNRYYFREVENSMSNPPHSMFSVDPSRYVVQPYTVAITMLQFAAYLGFDPIYLIGCDTSYTIPASVKHEGRRIGDTGLLLTSTSDDDPNHFDPRYFGQGREWHNPQVTKMLEHYRWAKVALNRSGIRVRNATVGGQLEVFPRVEYENLF